MVWTSPHFHIVDDSLTSGTRDFENYPFHFPTVSQWQVYGLCTALIPWVAAWCARRGKSRMLAELSLPSKDVALTHFSRILYPCAVF